MKKQSVKRVSARDEMLRELQTAGQLLSNAVFNMSQRAEYIPHDRKILGESVRRWDTAVARAKGAKVLP